MENESQPIFRLEHSGIVVPDLEAAVEFYTRAFGLVPIVVEPDFVEIDPALVGMRGGHLSIRGAYLRAGSASVEIHQYSPSRARGRATSDLGFGHLSFAVNDIGRACEYLRTQGMSFYTEPNFIDSGAMDGRWWVYGEDPWGNVIEIAQPSSD